MARERDDEFSQKTIDILAKRVGVRCSNPGCRKLTTGPRSDTSRIISIGVGAHISAASPGGKRYDASLTSEQRSSEHNGIWLCQNCGKLIDNDSERYTAELLRAWKQKAETSALAEIEGSAGRLQEDAAEIELTVGGVAVGGQRLFRSQKGYDESGTCVRHDYELAVIVRNLGNSRLTDYHVDLDFPTRVLESPDRHVSYVAKRSTDTRAFFRASGNATPELFPGDAEPVITLPYYVDDDIFWNHYRSEGHTFAEAVRVTLHRTGLPPITVELPFKALQNF
jgi:hypothetical protein